jgi:hypothetical protein
MGWRIGPSPWLFDFDETNDDGVADEASDVVDTEPFH